MLVSEEGGKKVGERGGIRNTDLFAKCKRRKEEKRRKKKRKLKKDICYNLNYSTEHINYIFISIQSKIIYNYTLSIIIYNVWDRMKFEFKQNPTTNG